MHRGFMIVIALFAVLMVANYLRVDSQREAIQQRLRQMDAEEVARREAAARGREVMAAAVVNLFPERKARIAELMAQLRQQVEAEAPAPAIRQELRQILEPVFVSEIGNDPEVLKLKEEYEFWTRREDAIRSALTPPTVLAEPERTPTLRSGVWRDVPNSGNVRKKDGTYDERANDLSELCKDFLFYRERIARAVADGDAEEVVKARAAFQRTINWMNEYPSSAVGEVCANR